MDVGLVKRQGTQLEQKPCGILVIPALQAANSGLLEDGKRNAQRRLPQLAEGVEL
jgi:hypothetical protein